MIYGIGLPRTGSSTLAEALRLLGYKGTNYCILYNDLKQDTSTQFIVNNSFFNRLDKLYSESMKAQDENLFILTTRNSESWNRSIVQYPEHTVLPQPNEYESVVKELIPQHQLLVVDWEEGDGWRELCNFVDSNIPIFDFPCKNC
jgi:hypothetical protein